MGRHFDRDGDGVADWALEHPYQAPDPDSLPIGDEPSVPLRHARVAARSSAAGVLQAYGLTNVDAIVVAARLEGLDVAAAATCIAKESGGANVWGHDPVSTGGVYTKGAQVTREAYNAYRALVTAGRIGRQGVGPCQCTSAGYQNTADALGGCWDPVANMRSGFRGLAKLINAYGVQGGAQRYNGSGPAAVAYGRDFLARYSTWRQRLAGTSFDPVTPVPAAYGELMQDKYPLIGIDVDIWDVACGAASFDGRRIFLGITLLAGHVNGWIDLQNDKGGTADRKPFDLTVGPDNLSPRFVLEVPSGTTKARVGWDATKAQKACLTVTGGK